MERRVRRDAECGEARRAMVEEREAAERDHAKRIAAQEQLAEDELQATPLRQITHQKLHPQLGYRSAIWHGSSLKMSNVQGICSQYDHVPGSCMP